MENQHPSQWPIDRLEQDCRWTFGRASGPGGQHRNKVETAARIEHLPSGTRASATEERSQSKNRDVAMHRLRCQLAIEINSPDFHTGLWENYNRQGKIRIATSNPDYPALLAETIGTIRQHLGDLKAASESLGTSATQLIKLLATYPPALDWLNRERVAAGMPPRYAP